MKRWRWKNNIAQMSGFWRVWDKDGNAYDFDTYQEARKFGIALEHNIKYV